jgi:WD40 repeat protein
VFLYISKPNSWRFILLGKGTYTTNCLTQIRFLDFGSSHYLVTGATDGHLALWSLDSLLDPRGLKSKLVDMRPILGSTITVQTIHWQSRFSIHSSSIKSLDKMRIPQDREVFIGGGDDNSLSITVLEFDDKTNEPSTTTVSIPNAHASAVTAIKILDCRSPSAADPIAVIKVVSAGNDQRVKFWTITINVENQQAEAINVIQEADRYCPAADISSMDILNLPPDDAKTTERHLLVAGVGMEMLVLKD